MDFLKQGSWTSGGKKIFILLSVLLIIHTILLWYGYDRLPLLPVVGDGPLIQDPAYAIAHNEGLVAPSYNGTLDFQSLYAHHPPVYIYLQSVVFRLLGLSPLSLRLVSLVCNTLYIVLSILCFYKLKRMSLIDSHGFLLISLLLLAEPATFYSGRLERMDSLVNLFSISGFFLILHTMDSQSRPKFKTTLLAILGSVAVGMAVATHVQGVISYFLFGIVVFSYRKDIGKRFSILLVTVPPMVFALLWVLVYQEKSLEAFLQLRAISSYHEGGWISFLDSLSLSSLTYRQILQLAPIATTIIFVSWIFGAIRISYNIWVSRGFAKSNIGGHWIRSIFLALTVPLLFVIIVAGDNPKRFVVLFPFGLICFGVALYRSHRYLLYASRVFTSTMLICSIFIIAGYMYTMITQWGQRDPERFQTFVNYNLPIGGRIAASPEFWYVMKKNGRQVRIIDFGFAADRLFWQTLDEDKLQGFDYIILPLQHDLISTLQKLQFTKNKMEIAGNEYIVFTHSNSNICIQPMR